MNLALTNPYNLQRFPHQDIPSQLHILFFYNPMSIVRVASMYVGVRPISEAWAIY